MAEKLELEKQSVTKSGLDTLRKQYLTLKPTNRYHDAQFEYAVYCIRSPIRTDRICGIQLLNELLEDPGPTKPDEIYFFLAQGHWWNEDYVNARGSIEAYLKIKPSDERALAFQEMINEKIMEDGMKGMAIVAATAATVGVVAFGLARAFSK